MGSDFASCAGGRRRLASMCAVLVTRKRGEDRGCDGDSDTCLYTSREFSCSCRSLCRTGLSPYFSNVGIEYDSQSQGSFPRLTPRMKTCIGVEPEAAAPFSCSSSTVTADASTASPFHRPVRGRRIFERIRSEAFVGLLRHESPRAKNLFGPSRSVWWRELSCHEVPPPCGDSDACSVQTFSANASVCNRLGML